METINAIEQQAWAEYELIQGDMDAEREEREEQELIAYIESRFGGYDDDGSRSCYNALTNDPQEWK